LLDGIKNGDLDGWPEKVRIMQENWIGRSEGALVNFDLTNSKETIQVYTTRPDTLFGASFLAIAADHKLSQELAKTNKDIAAFVGDCKQTPTSEEAMETMEKKGIFTGLYVKHPFDENWKIPAWIANFILMDYGTGAIFGCPAHDERDYDFAKKYNLAIKRVVASDANKNDTLPYIDEGVAVDSQFLDGLRTQDAKKKSIEKLVSLHKGERKVNYRLRDWGISRQRYWGCPIPVVYCEHCGIVPEKEENLPIKLPDDVVFDGRGNPLENHPTWKHTKCPICGKPAIRETDTMDTFVDSSWYFMRFIDLDKQRPVNKELCDKLLPMDQYVGGVEHATMHLIYARFFTKVMRDLGYFKSTIKEPAKQLFNQGMLCYKAYKNAKGEWFYPQNVEEKNGKYFDKKTGEELICEGVIKMSKSKCNVVDIDDLVQNYGADSARIFILSDTPASKDFEYTEEGIEACWKYLNKMWKFITTFINDNDIKQLKGKNVSKVNDLLREQHKAIRDVTNMLEVTELNRAIARIREFSNALERFEPHDEDDLAIKYAAIVDLVKMLAPFTPHICEELNQLLGQEKTLDVASFPTFDSKLVIDDTVMIAIQVNGKLRGDMQVEKDASEEQVKSLAMAQESVKRHLSSKVKKVIIVPNKLINFVTE